MNGSERSERRLTQIGDIHFEGAQGREVHSPTQVAVPEQLLATSKRHRLAEASPVRGLPVNVSPSFLGRTRTIEHIPKRAKQGLGDKPQHSYHEFMSLDQAGPATMAYDNEYNLYAIKKRKAPTSSEINIRKITTFQGSDCVVCLLDVYRSLDEVHMVYEYMDASLRQVLATPRGQLSPCEIAVICREVLNGLSYIHEDLGLHHGDLSCGQLLLSRAAGHVKIANIGERMLEQGTPTQEQREEDVQRMGLIMIEIMEPATSLEDRGSTTLRYPERWSGDTEIHSFLRATADRSSARILKDHKFLKDAPSSKCLIPNVLMAQVSARTKWSIFSPLGESESMK